MLVHDDNAVVKLWQIQYRMGYDYEIGQQVHLLEKNPLGNSCQLLVT